MHPDQRADVKEGDPPRSAGDRSVRQGWGICNVGTGELQVYRVRVGDGEVNNKGSRRTEPQSRPPASARRWP